MAISDEEIQRFFSRSEELLDILRKSREFTQQLMQENERLRYRIVQLEQAAQEVGTGRDGHRLGALEAENERLREKVAFLERRFSEVKEENEGFAQKYLEISQQNEGLANLYVASFQLHSTLDSDEVMGIVKEIVINLVGSEEFAIFLADMRTGELSPVAWEGPLAIGEEGAAPWDAELVERVARSGEPYYAPPGHVPGPGRPLACVPLTIKREVVGVIAVFRLLVQKSALTLLDREILNLLAAHAATAIVSSRLYADADRKLKTIEGFMELLKPR